ncbi:hypothetical protein ACIRD9_42565 [Streptomyces violaceus]|uniref:hypothetical protein n=1 Tax=Streptomyces violaceus TaxID=1936 RepID=UPI0038153C23
MVVALSSTRPSSSPTTETASAAPADDIEDLPTEARLTSAGKLYPQRVPWEMLSVDFIEAWGRPNGSFQPEHVEVLGPTGSGKSYWEKWVLQERVRLRRSAVVILLTKPADKTLATLDWPVITKWPPSQWNDKNRQVIFHAKSTGLGKASRARQAEQVEQLLDGIWHPDANVVLAVDEIAYVEQELGLRTHMTTFFREGRTLGITIMASTQRPAGVSRAVHSETAWVVCFAPKDEDDAERMAQILGEKRHYRDVLMDLDREKREFVLVHNLTREAYISHIPDLRKRKKTAPKSDQVEPGTRRRGPRAG